MDGEVDLLEGSTTYLSGPMDFVADRGDERRNGWRSRISEVLADWGVRVFDPWNKPLVTNLRRYGIEDETSNASRKAWRFEDDDAMAKVRSEIAGAFWPVMHIDLRMVDLSDFVIACCPTNLYSVGTPHEIVVARQQRKPVLLVSPPVVYPLWNGLRERFAADPETTATLKAIEAEVGILENPTGTPSSWYATLVGTEAFFDGFGWAAYRPTYGWQHNSLDEREAGSAAPIRPLLPYLDELRRGTRPRRWDVHAGQRRDNDDWLLLERRAEDRKAGGSGRPEHPDSATDPS